MTDEKNNPADKIVGSTVWLSGLDLNDIIAIVLAEFTYWKEADIDQSIGGMGAASNILAAIKGHRAPWHPKPPNAAVKPRRCDV